LRIGGGGCGPQSRVRVEGGLGESRQVLLVGPELFCFPRVWDGFGVQLGVVEHFLELPKSHSPRVPVYRGSSLDPNPGCHILSCHVTHNL